MNLDTKKCITSDIAFDLVNKSYLHIKSFFPLFSELYIYLLKRTVTIFTVICKNLLQSREKNAKCANEITYIGIKDNRR